MPDTIEQDTIEQDTIEQDTIEQDTIGQDTIGQAGLSPESSAVEVQAAAGNKTALAMQAHHALAVTPQFDASDGTTTGGLPAPPGTARMRTSGRAGGRQSQSPGRNTLTAGGMGYIGRRGVPYSTALALRAVGGVERLAEFQPLELLMLCADLVPEVSQAVWNFLLLGCSPGYCTLSAVTPATATTGEETCPADQAILDAFFEDQPQETGDFNQQLVTNTLMILFSGMAATEYVPGPEMSGQGESYPIDTLTLVFRRDSRTGRLVLDQRQVGPTVGTVNGSGVGSNLVPMPMNRFFWDSIHRFPDDPYGRAPFGAALTAIFDYLAFMRDLSLAFHRIGMPRYDVEYDFEAAIDFVTKIKQINDPDEIAMEVKRQFQAFVDDFNTLQIDDTFFHPKGTKVNVTGSAQQMPDVDPIFNIYRYRLILALKQNPVLMSFVEGSTETWSEIQWEEFLSGLLAIVTPAVSPLKDAAQLHLQLLGKTSKVKTVFDDARVVNALQTAQAVQIQIGNEAEKRDQGWQSQDSASQKVTGSMSVGDPPSTLSEQEKQAKADKLAQQQQQANALKVPPKPQPAKK